jgi:hypothetical protein
MLEHDGNAMCMLCQLVQQSLLQKPQTIFTGRFSRLEHDDRSTVFIELRIKPVAEIEASMDVWLVEGIVEEVVNWH